MIDCRNDGYNNLSQENTNNSKNLVLLQEKKNTVPGKYTTRQWLEVFKIL